MKTHYEEFGKYLDQLSAVNQAERELDSKKFKLSSMNEQLWPDLQEELDEAMVNVVVSAIANDCKNVESVVKQVMAVARYVEADASNVSQMLRSLLHIAKVHQTDETMLDHVVVEACREVHSRWVKEGMG